MTKLIKQEIFCCGCDKKIEARLTNGAEVYPHREDLHEIPFWKCDQCKNFVGCHHKTKDRTRPLGCIATPELLKARHHIHAILDPIWKSGKMHRGKIYAIISEKIGYPYHTGEIRNLDLARRVWKIIKEIEVKLCS